jgi:two-component system, NtrC family, sensor histidine kinase HydH
MSPGAVSAWENEELRISSPVSQKLLVGCALVLLALSHWLLGRDKLPHNLLFNLDFIPILLAAMLFGWQWAVGATVLTLAIELPHLWAYWPGDTAYQLDQIAETVGFGVAGGVVGILAGREREHRKSLEEAGAELARVNRELIDNLDRLTRAERMYAVAELSASLAHEIRNPLASISGAAGILSRGQASPENRQECFDIIQRESQRLNKLLANFLDFARPRAPRFQMTDLVAVMDSTIALARHSGEAEGITFERKVVGTVPEVPCDPEQLKQVLFNLVINAVHATGSGKVELWVGLSGGAAVITVRDEGKGIPKDQEGRIFEPFFTTKSGGSGLGLAIAGKIVEQHGGTLTARNTPGKGLTMELQLPLTEDVHGS